MKSGIIRTAGIFAFLLSSDNCSLKKSFHIFALAVLSEYICVECGGG